MSTPLLYLNVIYRSLHVVRLRHMKLNVSTLQKVLLVYLCCVVLNMLLFKAGSVRIPFSNIILLSVISARLSGSSNVRSCHILPVRQR